MAIKKNTAAAETKEAPAKTKAAPAKSAPAKTTKAASAKASAAPEKATTPKAPAAEKVPAVLAEKVSRKDLAAVIQEKVKSAGKAVPLGIAEIMVVAYEEAVAEALAAGKEVNLPGFGKFVPVQKEEAEKRNPATGEMVTVAAHVAVRFKVGSKLKQAANGGNEAGEDEENEAAE